MMTTQKLSYIPKLATGLLQRAQGELHLLLDPEKPAWAVVNLTGMEIVRLCDGVRNIQTIAVLLAQKYQLSEKGAREDVLGYIHNLANAGLLHSDADEPAEQHQMPVLKGVYLHVTNRCNLRCKHCYAAGTRIGEGVPTRSTPYGFKEICRLIDQLVQAGGGSISLSGGEPLERRDIKQILIYASKYRN